MSTELEFRHDDVFLTCFWGGSERGRCIQITVKESTGEHQFIQLPEEKCADLGAALIDFAKGRWLTASS